MEEAAWWYYNGRHTDVCRARQCIKISSSQPYPDSRTTVVKKKQLGGTTTVDIPMFAELDSPS
jgi:hypothetical protein